MIFKSASIWVFGIMVLAAAESPDLLRFTNGDQLHGKFTGIKDESLVVWRRDDISAPVELKPSQLRHIVLRGGKPQKALPSFSHLTLVNGDSIPGKITRIDDTARLLGSPAATVELLQRYEAVLYELLNIIPLYAVCVVAGEAMLSGRIRPLFTSHGTELLDLARECVTRMRTLGGTARAQWHTAGITLGREGMAELEPATRKLGSVRWSWRTAFEPAMIVTDSLADRQALRIHVGSIAKHQEEALGVIRATALYAALHGAAHADLQLLDLVAQALERQRRVLNDRLLVLLAQN